MFKNLREFPRLMSAISESLDGEADEWKNLKRLILGRSEVSLYYVAMKSMEWKYGRDVLLSLAGKFIVVLKYGDQPMKLRYENVRSVRTTTILQNTRFTWILY